jgi:hypothetical protein
VAAFKVNFVLWHDVQCWRMSQRDESLLVYRSTTERFAYSPPYYIVLVAL